MQRLAGSSLSCRPASRRLQDHGSPAQSQKLTGISRSGRSGSRRGRSRKATGGQGSRRIRTSRRRLPSQLLPCPLGLRLRVPRALQVLLRRAPRSLSLLGSRLLGLDGSEDLSCWSSSEGQSLKGSQPFRSAHRQILSGRSKHPDAIGKTSTKRKVSQSESVGRGFRGCLLYTSPSPRDLSTSRMPSSA